jgi:fructokinase
VTLATPRVGDALVAMLASHDALTSLDPNVRAAFVTDTAADAERLDAAVSLLDLVRCSDEDLSLLYPGRAASDVAAAWRESGASAVVVTRGGGGAMAWTATGEVAIDAPAVAVVDTVGAGDTFGAGLLTALVEAGATDRAGLERLDADAWRSALTFAARAAAVTVGRRGADPPHRAEV